jgi:hypothetical protein
MPSPFTGDRHTGTRDLSGLLTSPATAKNTPQTRSREPSPTTIRDHNKSKECLPRCVREARRTPRRGQNPLHPPTQIAKCWPPSTGMICPVTNSDPSINDKIASATSSGVQTFPSTDLPSQYFFVFS